MSTLFSDEALFANAERSLTGRDLITRYEVRAYSKANLEAPIDTWYTYGGWSIEGDFLIVWDEKIVRHGYRIPSDADMFLSYEASETENDPRGNGPREAEKETENDGEPTTDEEAGRDDKPGNGE